MQREFVLKKVSAGDFDVLARQLGMDRNYSPYPDRLYCEIERPAISYRDLSQLANEIGDEHQTLRCIWLPDSCEMSDARRRTLHDKSRYFAELNEMGRNHDQLVVELKMPALGPAYLTEDKFRFYKVGELWVFGSCAIRRLNFRFYTFGGITNPLTTDISEISAIRPVHRPDK